MVYDYSLGELVPDYDAAVVMNSNLSRAKQSRGLTPDEQLQLHKDKINRANWERMAENGLASSAVSAPAVYGPADAQASTSAAVNAVPEVAAATPVVISAKAAVPAKAVVSKRDPVVEAMQKELNAQGAGLKEDGIMGPKTLAAWEAIKNPSQAAVVDGEVYRAQPRTREDNSVDPAAALPIRDNVILRKGLAAKANGLDDSVAYWMSGDAPEGYIPTAKYDSFLDMFK